ncbi:T9SS type A sorting domain-containing protein [uncultured Psychroserpens sp.]|uniref:T9SS type A sorting domain-containing protein n=1 Tax=uncultured Psychroserpens sp. TaxID=255436 RepID=UPI002622FA6E|nr:T9SS type A sorting domain-containing protein [uncultured Psychroserpens sp.]
MKKITQILLVTLLFMLCTSKLNAQDGYTYTLQHNGSYSFTIQAVPNTSTNNFLTSVQSYGFTIILPDGVTITPDTSLGSGASSTFFDGVNVAQPTIDGYLITETLGSPISLSAPSSGMNSDMYTFTVNGVPTSGVMYILENNSSLANTVTPLKSFMQADMVDNGMAEFANVVDPNGAGVSGMSSFNFVTLSEEEKEVLDFQVFPNPTRDILNIKGLSNNTIEDLKIRDVNGRLVQMSEAKEQLDVSQLNSGVYFLEIQTVIGKQNLRFIKH